MPPTVSLLLPNLDNRPFLEERMSSIWAQTFQDWELIVLDGRSRDGSWEYLQACAATDPRIRLYQSADRGIYRSFNQCVSLARGKYVYFATGDDTMARHALSEMVAALEERSDCDIAHCKLRIIGPDGRESGQKRWDNFFIVRYFGDLIDQWHIRLAPHDGLLHFSGITVYTSLTQLLIRRSLFERIGGFREDCGPIADFEWEMRATLIANTVHIPQYLASWRLHDGQASSDDAQSSAKASGRFIAMVRHALCIARRIEPETVKRLKCNKLLVMMRKEKFYSALRETGRKRATRLYRRPLLLIRHPLLLANGLRQKRKRLPFLNDQDRLSFLSAIIHDHDLEQNLRTIAHGRNQSQPSDDNPLAMDRDRFTALTRQLQETKRWLFKETPQVDFHDDSRPLLVYQMSKVGSSSVDVSLKARVADPVFHIHQLSFAGLDASIAETQKWQADNRNNRKETDETRVFNEFYFQFLLRNLHQHRSLREKLEQGKHTLRLRVISLVRDPIAREISEFFFNFYKHPELSQVPQDELVDKTIELLKKKKEAILADPNNWALTWFDSEFRSVLGIDIFQHAFDQRKGYSIIDAGTTQVLLIKMEHLDRCFTEAVAAFLHIPDMALITKNHALKKEYYPIYRQVLERITIRKDILDTVYNSKLVRHFYSPQEIASFIARWSGK